MQDALEKLYRTIESRKGGDVEASYVARLLSKGTKKIAQKVGEEAVEVTLAAASEGREQVIYESADLLFHLLVLWADQGIEPSDVADELARREGTSGIAEKAARK